MTAGNDTPADAAAWLIRLEGQTTPQLWDEFQEGSRPTGATKRPSSGCAPRGLTATASSAAPADGRVDRNLLSQLPADGRTLEAGCWI